MKKVLLIGRENDPHIHGIQKELEKINQDFYLLDSFSFQDSFQIKFPISKNELYIKNQEINLDEIKSIWNSNALKIKLNEDLPDDSKEFVKNEWHEGISSLWNSTDGVWVNDPESILIYGNRLKQLQLAHKLGLKIPETLITNNPDEFVDFYLNHEKNIIAKTLNSSVGLPEGKMIFTTKIKNSDIQRKDEIKNAPSMFQEYIPKKTEFRTTIIGNVIHSVEIHSQKSEKTKHDWRNYDSFEKTPYIVKDLPDNVNSILLSLMKKMNLKFGTVDVILTPNDEYYFLEINTNGRWWWIQELTGINIAKDVGQYLANPYI